MRRKKYQTEVSTTLFPPAKTTIIREPGRITSCLDKYPVDRLTIELNSMHYYINFMEHCHKDYQKSKRLHHLHDADELLAILTDIKKDFNYFWMLYKDFLKSIDHDVEPFSELDREDINNSK